MTLYSQLLWYYSVVQLILDSEIQINLRLKYLRRDLAWTIIIILCMCESGCREIDKTIHAEICSNTNICNFDNHQKKKIRFPNRLSSITQYINTF